MLKKEGLENGLAAILSGRRDYFFSDLHIHSRFSRATSQEMTIPRIAYWAALKGLRLVSTGDFTHGRWLAELKHYLEPVGNGLFQYKGIYFILNTEVNNIYFKKGKVHKIHNLIFAPEWEIVEHLNEVFSRYGNLEADGRPILNLDTEEMVKIVLDLSPDCFIVPAHIWTPHFSLYGSNSGFNGWNECFGSVANEVFAAETGLSSDPAMNWRLPELDRVRLISNSDAHSPQNLGREVNVFIGEPDYFRLRKILADPTNPNFLGTVEFFPEEGKYHYDGHRNCNLRISPKEAIARNNRCSVCGQRVTVGVLHRVEELARRVQGEIPTPALPYQRLLPLIEIIADIQGVKKGSNRVEREYEQIINQLAGGELAILLTIPEAELRRKMPARVVEGILLARSGKVTIQPGYDGNYGEVRLNWEEGAGLVPEEAQLSLF